MTGIVQTVDVTARLVANQDYMKSVEGEISVVDLEVERGFHGGGSTAEVTAVFQDQDYDDEFLSVLSMATGRPHSIGDITESDGGITGDDLSTVTESELEKAKNRDPIVKHTEHPLDIEIEVTVEDPIRGGSITDRIFTGHVIKVTESSDGTITFGAMDARYYFNKNMVTINTGGNGESATVVLAGILLGGNIGSASRNTDDSLGFDTDSYNIVVDWAPTITDNFGVEKPVTAFEVVSKLASKIDAVFYIDQYNHVNIKDYGAAQYRDGSVDSDFTYWGTTDTAENTLPPITEFKNGDEEGEESIIVESPYDETAQRSLLPVAEDYDSESNSDNSIQGHKISDKNVFSRETLERERDNALIQNALTTDSGTMRVLGWPAIHPNDQITLQGDGLKFSPISGGTYTVKTVRHIVDSQEGYVSELELGKDLESLYREFVDSTNAEDTADGVKEQKNNGPLKKGFNTALEQTKNAIEMSNLRVS